MEKPNCNQCVHRRRIPGDAHFRCNNLGAKVKGNPHGITNGWFAWPFSFDPVWLVSCDSFSDKPEDNLPEGKSDPLMALLSMLR